MPKMGESIIEATILNWVKNVGDAVEEDETILEIATDKVDSEVPSPVDGVISEIRFEVDDVVPVGEVIAIISTEAEQDREESGHTNQPLTVAGSTTTINSPAVQQEAVVATAVPRTDESGRFYSPLVRNIAQEEGIALAELSQIAGSGMKGRVTKKDMLAYLEERKSSKAKVVPPVQPQFESQPAFSPQPQAVKATPMAAPPITYSSNGDVEIIEMDRMRRLIADHMVRSVQTSPHVTSFVEADVTNIVNWRNRVKGQFQQAHGQKITFTPIFVEAVVKALQDFPMVNVSVDGNQIIRKKYINIGMATALPSGNLIVPVIKGADHLSLMGLTKTVNDLANRARQNKLKPAETQDGTFTLTNVGTFGNVMGTPIINQPQVAILATGAIRKKPAVLETAYGDVIAVRQMMYLSLSYDHRVVDGVLGGSFLRRIADYLEQFDVSRGI